MIIKEKVLKLMENNKGVYYSGQAIADNLNVSRAAVWKAIKSLQAEGYHIDAVNNKGYSLSPSTDILSPQGIYKYLITGDMFFNIHVLSSVVSTNSLVREKANESAAEGYTVIANEQTGGRGRNGRIFYSPRDTGAYLSILLRPADWTAAQSLQITTMAAVAMCDAIGKFSDKQPQIKWVNDIFLNGKKVCGILTEGAFSMESGMLDYAILGVGINIYDPEDGFPPELSNIAGSVFSCPEDDIKNKLVGEFLARFLDYYSQKSVGYAQKYRDYSMVIGKNITVIQNGAEQKAHVNDIDDQCQLHITYENGKKEILSCGEIRVS